eukprot:TRINITY_DN13637_c0_g1_i5.p1 TRINITY_DN13637_c0_g1~~TRINITY_DN13637_c0_g1_i5.p1  ORF type:complete len:508 (+),score=63.75 TRINITY_DN13637_c0_g1_i5:138-1661(+)
MCSLKVRDSGFRTQKQSLCVSCRNFDYNVGRNHLIQRINRSCVRRARTSKDAISMIAVEQQSDNTVNTEKQEDRAVSQRQTRHSAKNDFANPIVQEFRNANTLRSFHKLLEKYEHEFDANSISYAANQVSSLIFFNIQQVEEDLNELEVLIPTYQILLEEIHRLTDQMDAENIAECLQSIATSTYVLVIDVQDDYYQQVCEKLDKRICKLGTDFTAEQAAMIIASFQKLKWPLLTGQYHVADIIMNMDKEEFSVQKIPMILISVAYLQSFGYYNENGIRELVNRVKQKFAQFEMHKIPKLLMGLERLKYYDEELMGIVEGTLIKYLTNDNNEQESQQYQYLYKFSPGTIQDLVVRLSQVGVRRKDELLDPLVDLFVNQEIHSKRLQFRYCSIVVLRLAHMDHKVEGTQRVVDFMLKRFHKNEDFSWAKPTNLIILRQAQLFYASKKKVLKLPWKLEKLCTETRKEFLLQNIGSEKTQNVKMAVCDYLKNRFDNVRTDALLLHGEEKE